VGAARPSGRKSARATYIARNVELAQARLAALAGYEDLQQDLREARRRLRQEGADLSALCSWLSRRYEPTWAFLADGDPDAVYLAVALPLGIETGSWERLVEEALRQIAGRLRLLTEVSLEGEAHPFGVPFSLRIGPLCTPAMVREAVDASFVTTIEPALRTGDWAERPPAPRGRRREAARHVRLWNAFRRRTRGLPWSEQEARAFANDLHAGRAERDLVDDLWPRKRPTSMQSVLRVLRKARAWLEPISTGPMPR
jgi:hypothetical protein